MKRLTCEMCGSTDLIKQEGVFVCQSCGCKYSVEEARKMMIEGTVEVTGTVKIDNTGSISNYLHMAQSALDAGNNKEAEEYCNKIIEMDVSNWEAWLIKGKAAGWQSTLNNLRMQETTAAFIKALEYAPDEIKGDTKTEIEKTINQLMRAIISLRSDCFGEWPDEDGASKFASNIGYIAQAIEKFESKSITTIDKASALTALADQVMDSISDIQERIKKNSDSSDQVFKGINNCIRVVSALLTYIEDDNTLIRIYKKIIELVEVQNKNTESQKVISIGEEMIAKCESELKLINDKIIAKEKGEQQARNNIYWEEHVYEKQELEAWKSELTEQIKIIENEYYGRIGKLNADMRILNESKECELLNETIAQLEAKLAGLGIFSGRQKKVLQEQIAQEREKRNQISDKVTAQKKELQSQIDTLRKERDSKMQPLQEQVKEIDDELNKAR